MMNTSGCSGHTTCGCGGCRRERVEIDQLAKQTIKALTRLAYAEAEETDGPKLLVGTKELPGATVTWSAPIRLTGERAEILQKLDGRSRERLPTLQQSKRLYAIEIQGRIVYVGMAATSTVAGRIREHIGDTLKPQPAYGDMRGLHPILHKAINEKRPISVWIGQLTKHEPYTLDNKVLHAFEILSANLLHSQNSQNGGLLGYDPNTWTFEDERPLVPEQDSWLSH